MAGHLVILTGASGAGKTTLATHIRARAPATCQVLFFDSVSVPSPEAMQAEYGSGEQWQRATTLAWIKRLKPLLSTGTPILFEGQMRIAFIHEALAASAIPNAHILLVDCDDATRTTRLSHDRSQPHLANAETLNWATYLREEAAVAKVEILDTGATPFPTCVEYLKTLLI